MTAAFQILLNSPFICHHIIRSHVITTLNNCAWISNQLSPCSLVLLEKPSVAQPLKNFTIFYGTRGFIIVFTTVLHRSLSWAISIQSLTPNLSFSDTFYYCPPIYTCTSSYSVFPSGFPTKPYTRSSSPSACYVLHSSHRPWPDHSNYIWWRVQVMKALHYAVFSNHLPLRACSVQIFSSAPCF
jgi:hypothetical protein